jgi:hypothetical protein
MLEYLHIELPEWLYDAIDSILKFIRSLKPATITGIEFITEDGNIREQFFINAKRHVRDHEGDCKPEMKCQILAVKKIKAGKDKVKIYFDGNKIIFHKADIRTTYLKKV